LSLEEYMARPRLTATVLKGLGQIAGSIQAGTSADFMGYDEEQMDSSMKKDWQQVIRACEWIRSMQHEKKEKDKCQ
jgi:hypothetical protein